MKQPHSRFVAAAGGAAIALVLVAAWFALSTSDATVSAVLATVFLVAVFGSILSN
jgi:hypothetical protein